MKEINYNSHTTMSDAPVIKKLGVISTGGEMTPFVRNGVRFRVETVLSGNPESCVFDGGFYIVNLETNEKSKVEGEHYHFFSAYCEDDTVYVFGTNEQANGVWGGDTITMFCSDDLNSWTKKDVVNLPGWTLYNTSVCKSKHGYTMAFEAGEPREAVGIPFTIFFAESDDLFTWRTLGTEICYSKARYTACPALRYLASDEYYYMVCLEELPLARYAPYIYRSRDLVTWEIGLHNPVLWISAEDRIPKEGVAFDDETLRIMRSYMNINNCDLDFCEFEGKTYINYLTGNQLGTAFLCEAVYDGTLEAFLRSHFE